MTSQFIHLAGYPRTSRRLPHQTATGMIAELTREFAASQHIAMDHMCGARLIYGKDPYELLALAQQHAERAVDRRGFKIKKNSNIIFISVASYPLTRGERLADDGWAEAYLNWLELTISWALDFWKGLNIAIVEHQDEDKLHPHVVIVPRLRANRQLDVGIVHPGLGAIERVLDRQLRDRQTLKTTPRQMKNRQRSAYCHAMRGFQDEFHREVGAASGQTRLSNSPRSRVARDLAMTGQTQRQRHLDLNFKERDIIVDRFELERREAALIASEAALKQMHEQLAAERASLEAERLRFKMLKATRETLQQIQSLQQASANDRNERVNTGSQDVTPLTPALAPKDTREFEIEEFPTPSRISAQANRNIASKLVGNLRSLAPEQAPKPIAEQQHSAQVAPENRDNETIRRMAA